MFFSVTVNCQLICSSNSTRYFFGILSHYSKVSVTSLGRPIRPALISGFRSMKRLGVFILPPGWDASPSQGYPQYYAGTHLYTWVKRGTVRVKCLAQEHSNYEATTPPTSHYSAMVDIFAKMYNINPRKIEENKRKSRTLGFKADMLIIYNFFFNTSLSVYSELLTAFHDQCSLKLSPFQRSLILRRSRSLGEGTKVRDTSDLDRLRIRVFPAGLVSGWGTSKYATCCQEHTTTNYILTLKNANQARYRFC